MDKKVKKLVKEYEEYAEKNGFRLNPDQKMVEQLIKGLIENEEKYGKRYCPCRIQHNDQTICPCAYHKREIEEQGHCHCFLFVRKDN